VEYIKKEYAAYNIHIIKTDVFKTVTLEINFLRKIKKEEITTRNFLSEILVQSSKNYPTKRLLALKSNDLYGANISTQNGRIGNFADLSFSLQFLNEKYTEVGMQKKTIEFFFDTIFNPNIQDNKFDLKSFNIVKEAIKAEIKSVKDNMTKYALIKMLEKMGKEEPYAYIGFGYLDDLENITTENLYEYYKDVLRSDKVDIFVVGDVDTEEIVSLINENLKINTVKKDIGNPVIEHDKIRSRLSKVSEWENIIQSKLNIGCKLKNLSEFERKYVLLVYNEILGGSSESKLFKNVREKNSLVYYVNSVLKIYDNLLMIYCGLNKKDSDKALNIIKKEMTNMKKGDILDTEIKVAKEGIITSMNTITDSPARIIGLYFSKELTSGDDINKRIEMINKVTKEDIISLANKIKIDTVYLMYGEDN